MKQFNKWIVPFAGTVLKFIYLGINNISRITDLSLYATKRTYEFR